MGKVHPLSAKVMELLSAYIILFVVLYIHPFCFICIIEGIKRSNVSVMDKVHNQIVEIGPGNLKMSYSASGQYHKMFNSESGVRYLVL